MKIKVTVQISEDYGIYERGELIERKKCVGEDSCEIEYGGIPISNALEPLGAVALKDALWKAKTVFEMQKKAQI